MHVLILPSWFSNTFSAVSGIFFQEQAEALVQAGHKVGLVSVVPVSLKALWKHRRFLTPVRRSRQNGVERIVAEFYALPRCHRFNDRRMLRLGKHYVREYIERFGTPDIVHVHSFRMGLLAIWIEKTYGIPYVVTEHSTGFSRGLYSDYQLETAKKVYVYSRKNIAVSQQFKAQLDSLFGMHFSYVPNLVNTQFFTPAEQREQAAPFSFINVATLEPKKGQSMLIRAFAKVRDQVQDCELMIVGEGSEGGRLKDEAARLGLEGCVTLYGKAGREEVRDLMRRSDVFVLSSHYETFGVVVIEAMSCGLPVVATRSGGPESIITDERLGILCQTDATSLAEAMLRVMRKKHDGDFIRSFTVEHFSSRTIAEKLTTIYLDALTCNPKEKHAD